MIEKIKELQKLTNIEIVEQIDNKAVKVKFSDFKSNEYNEYVININDWYIVEAIKLAKKHGIKNLSGLLSLRNDIREVANHLIPLGEEYINFNLKNKFYDKDPFSYNRLHINELEAIAKRAKFEKYKPKELFTYNKHFDFFNEKELNQVIDELFEKEIII